MVSIGQKITLPLQTMLFTPRRFLVLFLPTWATDCLKRRNPELKSPLALYERIKGGLRLAAIDREGSAQKLRLGQNLADARAIVPNLTVVEIDHPLLEAIFADFADWHSNVSPIVSVIADRHAYGDLALDITGVDHLFDGEEAMLNLVLNRLHKLGYEAAGAVASTIGAAWAASHYERSQVIAADDTNAFLKDLPVAALRLNESQINGLNQVGLKRIGQLVGRDRKALQARFGVSLLTRLDQAHGLLEERLTPRIAAVDRYADRRFTDPIGLMDDVLMTAQDLAFKLAYQLEAEGLGAQAFHLFLYRVDHKVMTLSVNSGRATRDPRHIARLFANRSERLQGEYDAGFGIDMIRLAATSVDKLDAIQLDSINTHDGTADLIELYDRMASRLGPQSVVRSKLVNTYIPELAVQFEPAIARTPDDPLAQPDPNLFRPLKLLPFPEPITVFAEIPHGPPMAMIWRRLRYKFAKASGPERLSAEWWQGLDRLDLGVPPQTDNYWEGKKPPEPAPPPEPVEPKTPPYLEGEKTRDYYLTENTDGQRFWLFRQGLYGFAENPQWFLHGFFS